MRERNKQLEAWYEHPTVHCRGMVVNDIRYCSAPDLVTVYIFHVMVFISKWPITTKDEEFLILQHKSKMIIGGSKSVSTLECLLVNIRHVR